MASRHRIAETINESSMGDVEKYFDQLSSMIDSNSGVNDFKIISSDCHAQSAPLYADSFTKFNLTETAMDIVDLSKGYINMQVELDVTTTFNSTLQEASTFTGTNDLNNITFFIGFKSGAHIINVYNVYSNGRLTNCQHTKAKYESMITYNSKAKEEIIGRPGLYSPHSKVMEMSNCVCGTYITVPINTKLYTPSKQTIKIDLCIQVDDLLCFSACSYFARFMYGNIELELSPNLIQNMVFCPIPIEVAMQKSNYDFSKVTGNVYHELKHTIEKFTDYRFTQCGDYASCATVGVNDDGSSITGSYTGVEVTLVPSNLCIKSAKSYVHGFNIKSECKQNLINKFADKDLYIMAQHADWHSLSQLPSTNQIKCNVHVPLNNASQIAFTFPNSANQLTVTRNPHLEAVQCHINDRIIPDKFFSTLDNSHSEMILNALGMDSLFSAPEELLEALTNNRGKYNDFTLKKKSDDMYQLLFSLERWGSGCFLDGMSGTNVPIALDANFMYSTENPHYYRRELDLTKGFHPHNINMIVLSDAFWVCNKDGIEFIK